MKYAVLFLAFVFCCTSCYTLKDLRVEKRRYRKGYYVHVRPHRYTEPVATVRPEKVAVQQTQSPSPPPVAQRSEPAKAANVNPETGNNNAPVSADRSQEPTRSIHPTSYVQQVDIQQLNKPKN